MGVQDDAIRVLHVDDDPNLADVVAQLLEREDERITVTTARDAEKGMERLRGEPFDCVVSDYDMPGTNGIEFLKQVREKHGDLPFILFTGKGSESVASDAISAGVTDYLQKGGATERYEILANRIANVVEGYRSRRALERNQRRLSLFVEQSPLGVIEYDPDFEVVGWNPEAEAIFGYSAEEALGRDARFLVPEEERDRVASFWNRVLEEDQSSGVNRNLTADGDRITCEWHNRAVTDDAGEVLSVFSLVRDVTERERRKRRLETLIDNLPGMVYRCANEPSWPMEFVGGECERLTGYAAGELERKEVLWGEDVLHPDDRDRVWEAVQSALAADEPFELTYRITTRDGTEKLVWERGRGIYGQEGDLQALEGFISDVTDRVSEERRHDLLRDRVERAISATDAAIWEYGTDGDRVVRHGVEGILGLESGSLDPSLDSFLERIHPDDRERVRVTYEEALDAGDPYRVEFRVDDGDTRWIEDRGEAWGDADGPTRIVGFLTDITARKERERKIARLHEATRALVGADSPEAVAETAVGTVRGVLGMPVAGCWLHDEGELAPAATTPERDDLLGEAPTFNQASLSWQVFESGESVVCDDLSERDDSHDPDTDLRSEIIVPLGGHGVIDVGSTEREAFDETDLTLLRILATNAEVALDRVERETRLREERAFVEGALNAIEDAFYVFDPDGKPLRWNERLREVTGYTDEEIAGMDPLEFFEGDDVERIAAGLDEAVETGSATVEAEFVTTDGDRIPYEFTGSPLTGPDGELIGVAGVGRDVTERNRRERELRERNERLETFASVVSHDLRNPLEVARGQLELARRDPDGGHLEDLVETHDRMEDLVEDLLSLARTDRDVADIAPVSLAAVVEDAWSTVETDGATLRVETDRRIVADRSKLRRLFENLLRNSIEHGDDRMTGEDPDGGVTVTVGDHEDGFYLADDGPGIPPEDRDRVFERGYSTDERGTGFGLAIVAGIAEAHGWDVDVDESADGGARFEVTGVEFA
ncbi:hypothetical protein BRD00_12120 [Halobacteriales archaeon QS_8_69_26]|nr:MAG: hypothetical protein BRD00_12120 [Halobacteriales archaeon QS_8_69_26]